MTEGLDKSQLDSEQPHKYDFTVSVLDKESETIFDQNNGLELTAGDPK